MTSHAAVAAAIRQRLIEGRPAPLRGLGTLVRQHVASRVEERPDGTRVLLPPGETIGLAATGAEEESLAGSYARFRGVPDAEAEAAYAAAMDQIEARLAATGEVRLPGVGLLRRTSGGVVLGVEADLLQAVNRTYEGLAPVETKPPPAEPPPARTVPPYAAPPPSAPAPSDPPYAAPPPVERVEPSEAAPAPEPPAPQPAAPDSSAPPPAPEPSEAELTAPRRPLFGAPTAPVAPTAAAFDDETPTLDADFRDEPADSESDVDDDVLGEVVDDAMPAPFGAPSGPPVADLLSPTPDSRLPPPDAPASAPSAVDDWAEETWTAPAFDDAPLRAADPLGQDADPFEDADFDVVPPAVTEPAPEPAVAELDDDGPDVVLAPVVGPEVGVEIEGPAPEAAVAMPPDAPAADLPDPDAVDDQPSGRGGGWLWALVVVLLLAALAAAAWWFWPQIESRLFPAVPPVEQQADPADGPMTVGAEVPEDLAPPPELSDDAPDPSDPTADILAEAAADAAAGAAPAAASSRGPRTPVASASAPAGARAPGDRRALAPPSDQAILPPVLAGLSAADRDALSGRDPVDPEAEAWTLVVLSTPSRADAEALVERYRRAGYRASVLATEAGGRAMFRVAVGQFPSRDDAIRLRDRLPPQAPPDTWALDLQTL